MPPLMVVLAFAAGVAVGAKWAAIRTALGPLLATAGDRFDDLYAAVAQALGEQKEAVQDARAERQHRARASRTARGRAREPLATPKSQGRRPAKRARKRPVRRPRQVSVPSTSVADR